MNELREHLRRADPLTREPMLSDDEATVLRERVLRFPPSATRRRLPGRRLTVLTSLAMLGIVASGLDPQDVVAVFKRYDDAAFRRGILRFLEGATGSADANRTDIMISAIGDLARRKQSVVDDLGSLRSELIARDSRIAALDQALANQTRERDSLRGEVAELSGKMAALEQALSERTIALNGLRSELAGRDAHIASLLASTSWRITSPFRSAKRLLRRSSYSAARTLSR